MSTVDFTQVIGYKNRVQLYLHTNICIILNTPVYIYRTDTVCSLLIQIMSTFKDYMPLSGVFQLGFH